MVFIRLPIYNLGCAVGTIQIKLITIEMLNIHKMPKIYKYIIVIVYNDI